MLLATPKGSDPDPVALARACMELSHYDVTRIQSVCSYISSDIVDSIDASDICQFASKCMESSDSGMNTWWQKKDTYN